MTHFIARRPFTAVFLAAVVVFAGGFFRLEYVNHKTDDVAEQAAAAAEQAQEAADAAHEAARKAKKTARETAAQANRNTQLIVCLIEFSVREELTVGTDVEWIRTFRRLVAHPPAGGPEVALKQFLDATDMHLRTLLKVRDVRLGQCVRKIDALPVEGVVFELVSATTDRRRLCFGRPATMRTNKAVIHGSDRADVIISGRGTNLIVGKGGRDRICSGTGGDVVNAGQGLDRVNCGRGVDNAQQAERRRRCEG